MADRREADPNVESDEDSDWRQEDPLHRAINARGSDSLSSYQPIAEVPLGSTEGHEPVEEKGVQPLADVRDEKTEAIDGGASDSSPSYEPSA